MVIYLKDQTKPGGLEPLKGRDFRIGPELHIVSLLTVDVPGQLSGGQRVPGDDLIN
jgi:hypothetical protein